MSGHKSLDLIRKAATGKVVIIGLSREEAAEILPSLEAQVRQRLNEVVSEERTRKVATQRFLEGQKLVEQRLLERQRKEEQEEELRAERQFQLQRRREARALRKPSTAQPPQPKPLKKALLFTPFVTADPRFADSFSVSPLESVTGLALRGDCDLDQREDFEGPFTQGPLPALPWDRILKRDRNRWFRPKTEEGAQEETR